MTSINEEVKPYPREHPLKGENNKIKTPSGNNAQKKQIRKGVTF